ncbi:MAG: hypothetical protein GXO92_03980 [FCB group bacterium]|nr:hypothetical protein [FCB group bacterium]
MLQIEILVGVVVLLLIIWVFISSRKSHLNKADELLKKQLSQKEQWKKEKIMSYGQVQEIKKQLLVRVEEKFKDSPEQEALLKEIINDWAELKIRSFQERRSWIRRPQK